MRQSVLTAPLWMPTPNWSSRSIAAAVGVSQSFVARIWRIEGAEGDAAAELARLLSERRMTLVGVLVLPAGSCLVLGSDDTAPRYPDLPLPPRSARRLRTLLAADLARPVNGEDNESDGTAGAFWRVLGQAGSPFAHIAVTSGEVKLPEAFAARVLATGSAGWQSLLGALSSLPAGPLDERLVDLESRLRRWHGSRGSAFSWTSRDVRTESPAPPPPTSRARSARERALADDILAVVREGLADGTFRGGEDVSERAIAHRLHCGRARIRQALLLLADDGLVTASRHGAVSVRLPTVADVVEMYLARRALGGIAIRAAGRWTREDRDGVARLLRELGECADRGEVDRAQTVDLAFQNALARASGLVRTPGMLESLSQQLLMYISVLGVRYAYPPERILALNTAIFRAVEAKDHDRAVRAWQEKMDEGLQYMLDQVDLLSGRRRRTPPATSS